VRPATRLHSVDAARIAGIIAVLAIHTQPLANPDSPVGSSFNAATIINQLARFAVPMFFVLSGYFWAEKNRDPASLRARALRSAWRLLVLFVAWSAFYVIAAGLFEMQRQGPAGFPKGIYGLLAWCARSPVRTLFQGPMEPLWFLASLATCFAIGAVLCSRPRMLLFVAIALYATGLLGRAYSQTPIGFESGFNFRNGPFLGFLPFAAGYLLARRPPAGHYLAAGVGIFLSGLVMQFAETGLLHRYWGASLEQDFVAGTVLLGLGAALIALSGARFLDVPWLARLGPLTLGIYASHMFFISLLRPLALRYQGIAWDLLHMAAVLGLACLFAWGASKNRFTARFVM
jgi:surface polysaccharide O-acyltransferase-like enzyme